LARRFGAASDAMPRSWSNKMTLGRRGMVRPTRRCAASAAVAVAARQVHEADREVNPTALAGKEQF
jgi:hypothetical protein